MPITIAWPKAIFTLSIVMRFRRALQRTMNMAFSQSTETFTRTWALPQATVNKGRWPTMLKQSASETQPRKTND
jgi:hypothetical protein